MAIYNKKPNFEIILNDDMKRLGFARVTIINKNIIISFDNDSISTILSKFKLDDLEASMKVFKANLATMASIMTPYNNYNLFSLRN